MEEWETFLSEEVIVSQKSLSLSLSAMLTMRAFHAEQTVIETRMDVEQ
jgi:hypothetical protein